MSGSAMWIVVAVLAACGLIAWLLLKRGRRGDEVGAPVEAEVAEPVPVSALVAESQLAEPVVEAAPVVVPIEAPAVLPPPAAPPVAPPPPEVKPPPPPPPPPRAAPVPPPTIVRPPPPAPPEPTPRAVPPLVVPPPYVAPPVAPRPPPAVIERVLALEPATSADWEAAQPLTLLPAQVAAVAAAVAPISRSGPVPLYAVALGPGLATAIARGDQERMRSLGAAHGAAPHKDAVPTWLDSSAAVALVSTALAALASDRFLAGLGDEVRELKAAVAALPSRLATQGGASFKTLMQDLSKFTREARDNYASAIGKLAFRERVGETEDRAVELWRESVVRVDTFRQQIETLASLPRFGEVQVEKALATYRELQDQRSLQEIGGRVLAASRLLRISIGDAPAAGGGDPLASALAALQAGQAQDVDLASRMAASEQAAKGDQYVGKAEFEANRAALRKAIARITGPMPSLPASAAAQLASARSAAPLDAETGRPHRLLIGPASGTDVGTHAGAGLRWLETN